MDEREEKRIHDSIGLLGLRAQATAVGLLQLSAELRRAGVLDDDAITRVKEAIIKDLSLSRPSTMSKREFDDAARRRLDALFACDEKLSGFGDAALRPQPAG
jgi:hypothetical protein